METKINAGQFQKFCFPQASVLGNILDMHIYFFYSLEHAFLSAPTFWNTGGLGRGGPKEGTSSRAVTDT